MLRTLLLAGLILMSAASAKAAPVRFTLLHTNDIHSRFRPDSTPQGLGGIARIATATQAIRAHTPNSLLVDGGDWSEGDIYYREGLGSESLRLMSEMGYDAAVIGNHDWLNGADVLLDILKSSETKISMLGANVDTGSYARAAEFHSRIAPYVIKEVGGVKVALIGLVTYEFIFNKFLKPVEILKLKPVLSRLAKELRSRADVVVAISHNLTSANEKLLAEIPELDFIVGAHDHRKFNHPRVVHRRGYADGYVVEAGVSGQYLGRMDLEVEPGSGQPPRLVDYRLLQMDVRTPEDPRIVQKIEALENRLEARMGPVFHDHIGDNHAEISRLGVESQIGDLVTDAYRAGTGAELALDSTGFVYGTLHEGPLRTADIYNVNPAVFDPKTGKSWTVKILPIRGRTLHRFLSLLYLSSTVVEHLGVDTSGMELVFNPLIRGETDIPSHTPFWPWIGDLLGGPAGFIVRDVRVNGVELDPDRLYRTAIGGGVLQGMEFVDSLYGKTVPLDHLADTGIEAWRMVADYVKSGATLTAESVRAGNRIHTLQPNLGVLASDVAWTAERRGAAALARITARVANTGARSSPAGAKVGVWISGSGFDQAVDTELVSASASYSIPSLAPGESVEFAWDDVRIIEDHRIFTFTVKIDGALREVEAVNDSATRSFALP